MCSYLKATFHYTIQVADLVWDLVVDRSEAGRRPVASWNLAYHALASQIPLHYPGRRPGLQFVADRSEACRRPASELDST